MRTPCHRSPTHAPQATQAGLQPTTLRALSAHELTQVSGGLSVLTEVLKVVQGGGSVPPKKP
jgi:hypothetical protein